MGVHAGLRRAGRAAIPFNVPFHASSKSDEGGDDKLIIHFMGPKNKKGFGKY